MDPRFLDYYNRELAYLHELGGEFAESYPKVAGHLGMQSASVADPYVERLMEGFAFLAARIHLKIDAEFPRFSQRLLEVVYPHYLAPTPSMAIVQIPLDLAMASKQPGGGARLPRGTQLTSGAIPGASTRCTFVTGHELEAWPLEVVEASAGTPGGDLPVSRYLKGQEVKGEIRIRLRQLGPETAGRVAPDRLSFFLAADDAVATLLYEALVGHGVGVMVSTPGSNSKTSFLPRESIRPQGFDADQALLPTDPRVFQGYRLLHEYFSFPQRFLFVAIEGLAKAVQRLGEPVFELTVLLDRDAGSLAATVDRKCFELNCVPVVNVFPRTGNRMTITSGELEHHIVPDRTRPLDYEVYRVDAVEGFDRGNNPVDRFVPFYRHVGEDLRGAEAYFSVRREPRRLSENAARGGGRSSYVGSEVFLSLVDAREAPWPEQIDQLSVTMLLTNRDLPLLIPSNGARDLAVETDLPMRWARILRGPSRPRYALAEREITWRLINHLSLNYLALRDMDAKSGAVALRELLGLYGSLADPAVARHADAIATVETRSVTRRLPVSGPLVFGRGVGVTATVDEVPFAGSSPFVFGAVLEQFLARHVSMNMFCEFTLASSTRGKVAAWPPRWGGRPDA